METETDDEIRKRTRDWTDDERGTLDELLNAPELEPLPTSEDKPSEGWGMKFRDARCPALRHAAQQLQTIKADPQATTSDIHAARQRVELAAREPSKYWDAFHDWASFSESFRKQKS